MIQLDPSTDHERAPDFEGLIQRVGQRFIDGEGTIITIAEFLNCGPKMRWSGRKPDGTDRIYDDAGKNLSGDELPEWNLVGPAPDELAEAKAECQRLAERIRSLTADNAVLRFRMPVHRPGNHCTVDAPIRNIAPCDVEAEVSAAIRQALDTAFCVQYMRLPILVQIAFCGDTNVAPLHLEGEAWNQFIDGDVLWGASLVESEWKGGKFVGVYEVEAR